MVPVSTPGATLAATERLAPSLAAAVLAAERGAAVLRVHDVKETVQALRVLAAIR
jgi:dihydropteroate synthase